ncbi:MAG: AAA family ATPase, partial [Dehalococcoidia bacterium]
AIDLMDEASAMIRTEIDSMPQPLDEVERKVLRLEIEEAALKNEKDKASKERLKELQVELANARDERLSLKGKWEAEREAIAGVRKLREELERARLQVEEAERAYDLNRAAELRHGMIPSLEEKVRTAEEQIAGGAAGESRLLREEVTETEIAEIVSRWTGIPVTRLVEGEREKLLHLDDILHRRVVGQDEAVQAVADAVIRARSGIKDPRRPIGSFLFLGPTGVGKTELAKALAQALFDSEANLVRVDMSEYQERHTVSRLVGAPPGYVGYEEGGQLTEAVRRRPYSVVLFDEIEKAHPDVFKTLLQVLDDGRLTDAQGRTVDFKNTVIIMTSNIGSQHVQQYAGTDDAKAKDLVMEALREHFPPEFINRVDEIIVFHRLTKEQLTDIVNIQLRGLANRLSERKITIEFTDPATELLIEEGYDPVYGARPLKRTIQRRVLDPLALKVLQGDFKEGDTVVVDADGDTITFRAGEREPVAAS